MSAMSLRNLPNPNTWNPVRLPRAAVSPAKPAPAPAAAPVEATGALPPDAARLLKPEDVAARLGVSERTLERWRREGTGPAFLSLTSKTVRYAASAVDAFVAGAVRQNTAQA
jgi:predicted DNA-binding transcriptional regulator AlpA